MGAYIVVLDVSLGVSAFLDGARGFGPALEKGWLRFGWIGIGGEGKDFWWG